MTNLSLIIELLQNPPNNQRPSEIDALANPDEAADERAQSAIRAAALLEASAAKVETIVPFKRRKRRHQLAQERCISVCFELVEYFLHRCS